MKRKNNLYDEMLNYEKALAMYKKIKRNCKNKDAIFRFSLNLNQNIFNILALLKKENYQFKKYSIFMIKEPKYRIVMSENISDKLVNHMVSKYILIPALESKLCDCNIATRIDKGSKYGINLFLNFIKQIRVSTNDIYVLKIDISKYFYNIDHEILLNKVERYLKDKKALNLLKKIIETSDEKYVNIAINYIKYSQIREVKKSKISEKEKKLKIDQIKKLPIYKKGKGLPIGNMASQILAIFYLNDVDHFIKEKLHIKYYVRYMDDLLIFDSDKEKLKEYFYLIKKEINDLKLEVNKKSNIYSLKKGVGFLGYVFKLEKGKLLIRYNNQTIKKIIRKLKKLRKKDEEQFLRSYGSYQGYFVLSNTDMKNKIKKTFEQN